MIAKADEIYYKIVTYILFILVKYAFIITK